MYKQRLERTLLCSHPDSWAPIMLPQTRYCRHLSDHCHRCCRSDTLRARDRRPALVVSGGPAAGGPGLHSGGRSARHHTPAGERAGCAVLCQQRQRRCFTSITAEHLTSAIPRRPRQSADRSGDASRQLQTQAAAPSDSRCVITPAGASGAATSKGACAALRRQAAAGLGSVWWEVVTGKTASEKGRLLLQSRILAELCAAYRQRPQGPTQSLCLSHQLDRLDEEAEAAATAASGAAVPGAAEGGAAGGAQAQADGSEPEACSAVSQAAGPSAAGKASYRNVGLCKF